MKKDKPSMDELGDLLKNSHSVNEASIKFFGYKNSRKPKIIRRWMDEYGLGEELFKIRTPKSKYKTIIKKCPCCDKSFETKNFGNRKEKTYCSKSCGNMMRNLDDSFRIKMSKINKGQVPWNKGKKFTKSYSLVKCCVCETEFKRPKGKYRKTCSKSCDCKHRSNQNKKAYQNGNNFVAGGTTNWIEVETSNGIIKVQGSYEVRTCKILDKWKSQKKIKDWEYTNDRVNYLWEDGSEHTYLLDFKVINYDNSFFYVETKGYIREHDEEKWKATKEQGYKLEVWFDETLKKYESP
jgi:hypothetical protein